MPAPNYIPAKYSCWATVTPAASATDFATLVSLSGVVKVTRIRVYASQTSAGGYTFYIYRRTTANTGGTIAVPAIAPLDTNAPAPGAAVITYSANPSALGTSAGNMMVVPATIPATTSGLGTVVDLDLTDRPIVLRSNVLAVNGNAVSFGAGIALIVQFEWEEGGVI